MLESFHPEPVVVDASIAGEKVTLSSNFLCTSSGCSWSFSWENMEGASTLIFDVEVNPGMLEHLDIGLLAECFVHYNDLARASIPRLHEEGNDLAPIPCSAVFQFLPGGLWLIVSPNVDEHHVSIDILRWSEPPVIEFLAEVRISFTNVAAFGRAIYASIMEFDNKYHNAL